MNQKHGIEVVIQNKKLTLSGFEEEEYLQKIASYLNAQYEKLKEQDGYAHLEADIKSIWLQINIADDFYKEKAKNLKLKKINDQNNKELFDIKHEVIALNTELSEAKEQIETLKQELAEVNKKLIQSESRRKNHS